MKKADVEYHGLGYGSRMVPAVNVKVRGYFGRDIPKALAALAKNEGPIDPRFTADWIEGLPDDVRDDWWAEACREGWEQLQTDAEDIFGPSVKVYSEGRSEGWAYVDCFTRDDVERWDAVALSKWARFYKWATALAADTWYRFVWDLYHNHFETWAEQQGREVEGFTGQSANA